MNERIVEVTTSGKFFTPEGTAYFGGRINREDGRSEENQVNLEIYAVTHSFKKLKYVPGIRKIPFFRDNPIIFEDGVVTVDRINAWLAEHKPVGVSRIHGAFHSDIPNALYNYCYHSVFKEPGTRKDRVIATAVSWMTMTAQNNLATRLAGEYGALLNFHRNIVERGVKKGRMEKLRGTSAGIWVENDIDYPRKDPKQFEREVSIVAAVEAIKKLKAEDVEVPEPIQRSKSDGLILGIDHAFRGGKDPRDYFEEHKQLLDEHLKCIHICGSKGDHGPLLPDDKEVAELVKWLGPRIKPEVRFCLDTDPLAEAKLTESEQYDNFKSAVHMLQSV